VSARVIRDVGETLITLLRNELVPGSLDADEIALTSPADGLQQGIRLTLFLYSVTPTAELRNEPRRRIADDRERMPALPLDLYYLLTVFPLDVAGPGGGALGPDDGALDAHGLLGAAMQVFHDNGVLSGGLLQGDLEPETELRLTLQPITVEDLTRLWSVFPDNPYRTSVSYLVTPARVDSRLEVIGQRVVEKQVDADRMLPLPAGAA
jgi:hypothetical protein